MIDGASTIAEMYLEGYCRGPMLRISKTSLVNGASTLVETYLEGFTTVSFRSWILFEYTIGIWCFCHCGNVSWWFCRDRVCCVFQIYHFANGTSHWGIASWRLCRDNYYTPSYPVHSVSTTVLSHLWFLSIFSAKKLIIFGNAKSSNHCGNCQCQNEYFDSISSLFVRAFTLKTRNWVKDNDVIWWFQLGFMQRVH